MNTSGSTRAWPPRWHPPGGVGWHREFREIYTFHRWIAVEIENNKLEKSTSKPTAYKKKFIVFDPFRVFHGVSACILMTWLQKNSENTPHSV
jgi:hypothetical protein